MSLIIHWLVSAAAIYIAAMLIPGIEVTFAGAIIAAVVLGFINAILRPLLILLTLPINILTLGLFTLVINGALVMLAGALVPGFAVSGFLAGMFFSIALALVRMGISLMDSKDN